MCGGPSPEQKDAAKSQGALDNQLASAFSSGQQQTQPFYSNLLQNGDPALKAEMEYSTSDIARQGKLADASLNRRLAGFGGGLPSGFAEAAKSRVRSDTGHAFDANMLALLQAQQQAKLTGAQGLNPLAYAGGATSGNNSILQASSLKNNFWGNLVGGIAGGAMQLIPH